MAPASTILDRYVVDANYTVPTKVAGQAWVGAAARIHSVRHVDPSSVREAPLGPSVVAGVRRSECALTLTEPERAPHCEDACDWRGVTAVGQHDVRQHAPDAVPDDDMRCRHRTVVGQSGDGA